MQLQESFVEGGGLRAVKQWLEPVSGALPNYNIRCAPPWFICDTVVLLDEGCD